MEEKQDEYPRTENLVRRGLAETRRMADTSEADDVLAYIERGAGAENSGAEDESRDEDSGSEISPLERIAFVHVVPAAQTQRGGSLIPSWNTVIAG